MSIFYDQKKIYQLIILLFGTFTVYILYGQLYEQLIMRPFQNQSNNSNNFFASTAGFILLERGISWLLTELVARVFAKKEQSVAIPHNSSFLCGFFVFLSAFIFTHGVYTLSYRFSFMVRTGAFAVASLLGYLYSILFKKLTKGPKFIDIVLGLVMAGGMLLFWVYDPEICFFVPIEWQVFAAVMIVVSLFSDGILSIFQARINEEYRPPAIIMMRDITRWTVLCSLIFILAKGDLAYTIEFCLTHYSFTYNMIGLSLLYFTGQLFLYRAVTRMGQNMPGFLSSSRKVLNIQISFSFTVHKYHKWQIVGILLSLISIVIESMTIIKQKPKDDKGRPQVSYNQMTELHEEDGEAYNH